MKHLVGKVPTQEVVFCGHKINIKKLSVTQVFEIQRRSKESHEAGENEEAGMDMLQYVIGCAVDGADALTKEEFRSFPVDELSALSDKILKFSGLGNATPK
jgi:hypothetical protein